MVFVNNLRKTALYPRYLWITMGCVLFAVGVAVFLEPGGLAPGGMSGLAIVLCTLFPGWDVGVVLLCLNIPLLLAGWYIFGRRFLGGTLYATLLSAVLVSLAELVWSTLSAGMPAPDLFLSALCGGIYQALGIGMIFRRDATTGGTDIIVHLLLRRWNRLRAGAVFFFVDLTVVLLSLLTGTGKTAFPHTVLALAVFSGVLTLVLSAGTTGTEKW